jgi:sulfatase maturation enzyme AslB (radical SAM superfamily)
MYIYEHAAGPCCWYDKNQRINNIEKLSDLPDVFHSETFDNIRANPTGCKQCQTHEQHGGKSHRILWNEREPDNNVVSLENLDIYLGNLCNLACITCGSHNSTRWIMDEKNIFGKATVDKQQEINIDLSWELVKNLKRIKLAGGEILLMPQHIELLQKLIDFDVAKNITMVYIVNNTVDPSKFKYLFSKFKKVEFVSSVDGINEVNDYVRYLSSWKTNNKNIETAIEMGIDVSINCVVSILNVYHLPEMIEWWNDRGSILFRILNFPNQLSIKNLTENMRSKTIEKLKAYSELNNVVNFLKESPSGEFNLFNDWISKVDNYRGNSYWKINQQYINL